MNVIVLVVFSESSLKVILSPLYIRTRCHVLNSLSEIAIITSNHNHTVRIDILLELWHKQFCHLFFINFFGRFFFTILINHWLWLFRPLWSNIENTLSGFITKRETIKNIASVLAVILIKSPSESFKDKFLRNLLIRILL